MTMALAAGELTPNAAPNSLGSRIVRCMGVSLLTTILSVSIILVSTVAFGMAAVLANVLATSVATVPSYHLNRRWTWAKRDASDPWRELLPFWVLSFSGLVLSTVTVAIADSWAGTMHLAPALHTTAIIVGSLGGFGLLWVVQFVLLDRVLFAPKRDDEARISAQPGA